MPTVTFTGSTGVGLAVPITVNQSGDPVPTGTLVKQDNMTLTNAEAIDQIWGQHSEEGQTAGDAPNPGNRFEWRTADDGPLVNGIRTRYRYLFKAAANRRNEIGQVNNQTRGFVYAVGGEYVTRFSMRTPANVAWVGSNDNAGALMQMKHSSATGNGGFGGNPASSGPPMGIEAFGPNSANRMAVTAEQHSNETHVWEANTPHNQWFDMALHVRYDFASRGGFVNVYYALNGQPLSLVRHWDGGTIKENTAGQPMASTFRVGLYDISDLARELSIGPVRQERIA